MPKRTFAVMSSSGGSRLVRARLTGPAITTSARFSRYGTSGRYRGSISRGYTRRAGWYGRYNRGSDRPGELKFIDTDVNDAVVAAAGTVINSVNLIAQGVGEEQRVGRKCTIRSINMRWTGTLPTVDAAATPGAQDTMRFIIFHDKQANGATAVVADILEDASEHSFNNLSNKGRFNILYDKMIDFNYRALASDNAGVVSNNAVAISKNFYKKVLIPIEFSGATGAITEIRSNNISVLGISATGTCGYTSTFRLRFSDD